MAAAAASQWGDTFNFVALALLVFRLTGSGLGVSGVVVAEIVPVLLLAPVAGVLVDRLPRVRVMVVADVGRLVLAGLLVVAQHDVAAVYAVAFGLSVGSVFFNPAAASVLPALVDDDELVAANSGIWTAAVLSQVLIAPLAGLVVAWAGFGVAFTLNAASFAVSAWALRGLHVPAAAPVARRHWLHDARAGAVHLVGDRLLRALAVAQLLAAVSAGATSALLVVLAREHLRAESGGYGVLVGAIGVGAAAGPWLLVRLVRDPRRPVFVFGAFALRGLVDVVLATVRHLGAAAVAIAFYGVGTSTGAVTFNSLLQSTVPAAVRGRAFASFDLLWQSGRLASIVGGGYLADRYGIRAVYYLGGVLLLLAALVGTTAGRSLQRRPRRWRRRRPRRVGTPLFPVGFGRLRP